MKSNAPADYDAFCQRFANTLNTERAELEKLLADTDSDSDPVELDQQNTGRLSRMDAIRSQAMAQESKRRRTMRVQQIDAALKRIDEGEFGWCADCGNFIGEGRLDADPVFLTCVACAGK